MATDVGICSAALSLLGDKPISSLTEPNRVAATLCANIYPLAKADMMRAHPWNCLTTRVVLSPMVTVPAFEWRSQFVKPGDCLRIISVGYDGAPEPYLLEDGKILANTSILRLLYLADKGEGFWDANLTDTMVKRMVKDLAYPITKSASLAEVKAKEFEACFKRARAVDAQENPPEEWNDSPFIAVRGGARP